MSNKPLRIAQLMTYMNYGGVESAIMNYYRHIDKTKFRFDFFAFEGSQLPQKKEIESMGGKVILVPRYTDLFNYIHTMQKYLKNYSVVHSNMNTLSVFSLYAAKKAGVPCRILHNHSTAGKGEKKNFAKYMLRPFCKYFSTENFACSQYAGEWIFGKNTPFTVINNAIDIQKYKFDNKIRNKIRRELNIENKFVIGHIGRFCYQKNQEFLIDIFYEIQKRTDAVLILIGSGDTKNEIKQKVKKYNIESKVIFIDSTVTANEYYQAMDVFVLPSRYEGLGMVAIEAQTAGLPTVCSTEVPQEVAITDLVSFCGLSESAEKWADLIITKKTNERKDTTTEIKNAGYDINTEAEKLTEFYENLINKC